MTSQFLSVDNARTTILRTIAPLGVERIMLNQALGRVLGEPVVSPIDWPRFTNSAMDGYGVRWEDVEDGAATLEIQGEIPAGTFINAELHSGHAYRIMTGAPLAPGIDTVVKREDTDESVGRMVTITTPPTQGANIRHQGEDFSRGEILFSPGISIDSGMVGLLASFGRCRVTAHRQPRVAIISTGDELVELDEAVGDGQIINSSSYMLEAMVRSAGGIPVVNPIVRDERKAVEAAFDHAQRSADLVVSIGGVSLGDYDLVQDVILKRSSDVSFWKIKMKPGKPLAFGNMNGLPLIGLPGNPVSSFVTFVQFVRPIIRRLQNASDVTLSRVTALLSQPLTGPRGRPEYVRGNLSVSARGATFEPLDRQGSGNLRSVAGVNALGLVPAEERLEVGDEIVVERLP